MLNIFNVLHDRLCKVCLVSPKKSITYAWFLSLVLVFITFIISLISASSIPQKSLAFTGIWTVLLLVAYSIAGTVVMRRYQTPLALGFFLGTTIILSNQLLILTFIFGAENQANDDDASGWFAAFCFILSVVYAVFAGMLGVFRADLVRGNSAGELDEGNSGGGNEDEVGSGNVSVSVDGEEGAVQK